jgi:large subunit ribosomal protein L25
MLVSLTAEPRSEFGKGAARRTRRSGLVPAVVYGSNLAPIHVSLPEHALMMALKKPFVTLEINIDGSQYVAAPRQIQRDPVRQTIEHVDLVIIEAAEVAERSARADVAVAEAEAAAIASAEPIRGGGESEYDHELAVEAEHAAEAEAASDAAAADED